MATTIIPEVEKEIKHNCETRDYDCYISIGGDPMQHIGSAPDYSASETKCSEYVRTCQRS